MIELLCLRHLGAKIHVLPLTVPMKAAILCWKWPRSKTGSPTIPSYTGYTMWRRAIYFCFGWTMDMGRYQITGCMTLHCYLYGVAGDLRKVMVISPSYLLSTEVNRYSLGRLALIGLNPAVSNQPHTATNRWTPVVDRLILQGGGDPKVSEQNSCPTLPVANL